MAFADPDNSEKKIDNSYEFLNATLTWFIKDILFHCMPKLPHNVLYQSLNNFHGISSVGTSYL